TQTPRPGLPRSCRNTRRARAAARHRPAPPRPAPSDWPGLSPGRGTRSSLAGAAARNELILRELLVNNCGRLGPAPRPSSAPGTPLGEPRRNTTSQGLPTSATETEEAPEVPGGDEVFAPANALPARSEAAAVQPVIGISQRVRVNSKEKKDLGTLGYVLGITMMVIIVVIGAGIVLGYTYKRGKDLKAQHEQKVCERELQRITLPLSAFTNPTCEIVDEKTVVVHASQTPVDLQEGSAPLMGQAGTPGA
uniref:Phosphoinositide-3-kinase interacting protein 1 n=1 Tax=Bos taurus TaxID=9913 RepID=A0AAA9T0V0_BOVIN